MRRRSRSSIAANSRERCRCRRYAQRHELVPDCVALEPGDERTFDWLPTTCAYRKLAAGEDLRAALTILAAQVSTLMGFSLLAQTMSA